MTLALYKNVINGEIEGFFIIEDITDAKMDRMTLDLFYSKNYVITGIADLVNNSIYVKRENDNEISKLKIDIEIMISSAKIWLTFILTKNKI